MNPDERPQPVLTQLEYGLSVQKPAMVLYALTISLGVLPLVVGVIILILYLIKPSERLVNAGLTTILAGTVAVTIGFACLFGYYLQGRKSNAMSPETLRRRVVFAGVLLASNFPTAFVCILVAMATVEI
jgi:hypothetical protein